MNPQPAVAAPPLLAVALEAARAAATIIRDAAPRVREIVWREKAATDFVSEVDVAAESRILEIVRSRMPGAGVLAEESAATMTTARQQEGVVFVIDPLDGTTNFLHGYPEFAVSIGVLVEGVPAAGVVIDVPLGEEFTATAGGGAFCNGAPIHVSTTADPQRSLFGTGFPFTRAADVPDYLSQLGRVMSAAGGVRRAGAAALDLAAVAAGRFEGFFETRLSPWDIAAGILLVREAGGVATTFSGAPCPVAHTGIVAASAAMHPWLLRTISG